MNALAQSFPFAFRQLRKKPGFSLTIIFTLALGIGATTAIFSLVEGILLRPLPFKDADRLVLLGDHLGAGLRIGVTAREIETYSSETAPFDLSVDSRPPATSSPKVQLLRKSTPPASPPASFPRSAFNRYSAASLPHRRRILASPPLSLAMPFG